MLENSIKPFIVKVPIKSYNPTIIKSGIERFDKTKIYVDTSTIEGINNVLKGEEITCDERPSRANMQPQKNSFWFAKMKGSNKKLIISYNDNDLAEKYILSTGFMGIKSSKDLPLSLLTSFIISTDFNCQRDLHAVGTTMAGINNDTFLDILVPYLTKQEIVEHELKYSPFIEKLSFLRKKINNLKLIKSQLLNKYF